MTKTLRLWSAAAVALAVISTVPARGQVPAPFPLHAGDHICIIGNTLAERQQYDGWLDTLLYARFPKHDLVIRNLGFSGDEITTRLRSKNFGTPDEWLSGKAASIGGYEENRLSGANTKADVIFAFFGYNESYAGEAGLPAFKQQLGDWITHTLEQKYNGKSAPRIVLFSPIAHEDLGDPDIPFMMSDWEMGATEKFAPTFPNNMAAREQLRIAQRKIPRSAIIPTEMLPMSDNHHFDLAGYKIWGERAIGLIKESGWAAWATP